VPLEGTGFHHINVKDERQKKLEVMAVHEFLVRSAASFGRVHFDVAIGSSGLARRKLLCCGQVDAEIPDIIKDIQFEQIYDLLEDQTLEPGESPHERWRDGGKMSFSKVVKKSPRFRGFPHVKAFLSVQAHNGNKFVKELKRRSFILAKLKQVQHCLFLFVCFDPILCLTFDLLRSVSSPPHLFHRV
jgi:hypothetical protein